MSVESSETVITVWAPQSPNELWYALQVLKDPTQIYENTTSQRIRVLSSDSPDAGNTQRPPDVAVFVLRNGKVGSRQLGRLQQLSWLGNQRSPVTYPRVLIYVEAAESGEDAVVVKALKSLGLGYSIYRSTSEFAEQLKKDWSRLRTHTLQARAQPFHDQDGGRSLRALTFRVFLCHSHGDKALVRSLYQRLRQDGFAPWLDEEDLVPGQDWEAEIRSAVRECQVVLVCLSRASLTKEGFVQKEIRFALDVSDEKPWDTIYIIPTRFEECVLPDRLGRWHAVDLFDPSGYDKLLKSLRLRVSQLATRA